MLIAVFYKLKQDISFTLRGQVLAAVESLVFHKTISGRQLVFGETNKPILKNLLFIWITM